MGCGFGCAASPLSQRNIWPSESADEDVPPDAELEPAVVGFNESSRSNVIEESFGSSHVTFGSFEEERRDGWMPPFDAPFFPVREAEAEDEDFGRGVRRVAPRPVLFEVTGRPGFKIHTTDGFVKHASTTAQ
jgi:hypothetical protein